MEEMSQTFREATSLIDYNQEQAIRLFNIELENSPSNIAALGNRGLAKLKLAIKNSDKDLLKESKADLKRAIEIAESENKHPEIARANLKWAEKIEL